ncbi:MAG: transposase [Blastocatellia bacterium]|nr:transposase [Blastocatellia bacterium]
MSLKSLTKLIPTLWSRTYCILTCGGTLLEIIKQYIEQQNGID